jgi:hypothetical protein
VVPPSGRRDSRPSCRGLGWIPWSGRGWTILPLRIAICLQHPRGLLPEIDRRLIAPTRQRIVPAKRIHIGLEIDESPRIVLDIRRQGGEIGFEQAQALERIGHHAICP